MDLRYLSISEVHNGLVNGDFTCVALCEAFLDAIEEKDGELNSYITVVDRDVVLEQARAVDAKIAAGEEIGLLEGVPYGAKDMYCTEGVQTTAASKMLEGFTPPYDATVITKLKESGAILLGKLNHDEFAMGGSGEKSAYGVTRNPWDKERVPGGSSSGSAAAVAAGLCTFSLGTDTGGSIRQPAAFCGIVGWKPTYGRVSRSGVIPMTSSTDTMGVLARSTDDIVAVQSVIAGLDSKDSTTADKPVVSYEGFSGDITGMKVGVPKEYVESLDGDVKRVYDESIERLKSLGAEIVDISLPMTQYGIATYYVVCPCEVSANMERYDGIRYGLKVDGIENLEDQYIKTRGEGLGPEVKRRILIGSYALSAGYYDAYYRKAQKVRTKIIEDFMSAFKEVDIIATPASPTPAFKIGEKMTDPLSMYLEDVFMVPASLAGLCGVSVPADFVDGLPLGLQLIAPQFGDDVAFKVSDAFEKDRGNIEYSFD